MILEPIGKDAKTGRTVFRADNGRHYIQNPPVADIPKADKEKIKEFDDLLRQTLKKYEGHALLHTYLKALIKDVSKYKADIFSTWIPDRYSHPLPKNYGWKKKEWTAMAVLPVGQHEEVWGLYRNREGRVVWSKSWTVRMGVKANPVELSENGEMRIDTEADQNLEIESDGKHFIQNPPTENPPKFLIVTTTRYEQLGGGTVAENDYIVVDNKEHFDVLKKWLAKVTPFKEVWSGEVKSKQNAPSKAQMERQLTGAKP